MGRRGCVRRSLLVLAALGVLQVFLLLLRALSPPDALHSDSASISSYLKTTLRALNDFPTQQQQQQQLIPKKSKSPSKSLGGSRWVEGLPTLYIVTPTYPRAEQIPEITRTAQTLLNVPNVVWIVSEEADTPTPALTRYLNESALRSVYKRVRIPAQYQNKTGIGKPRGVANRMAGMNWVRENAKEGVLYFADDDNTYDIRIFEQMRWTQRVSMFSVGLVTKLGVSTPIVREGRVVGFYDGWIAKRKFPVDMAGFAVNVAFLLQHPEASIPFKAGREEDGFLRSLGITAADIEPLAFNCTRIWVWHTQTKKNKPATPVTQNNATIGSNLDVIKDLLWKKPAGSKEEEKRKKPAEGKEEEKRKKPAEGKEEEKSKKPAEGKEEEKRKKPAEGKEEKKRKKPAEGKEEEKRKKPAGGKEEEKRKKPAGGKEEERRKKPAGGKEEERRKKPAGGKEEEKGSEVGGEKVA